MFGDDLKAIRKQKGFSQEALAERLHLVRQTISKWENGLSVPDAEMLIRLADVLDTTVATLLGGTVDIEDDVDRNTISKQLEQLNALLAEKNRRSRRIWRTIAIVLVSFFVVSVLLVVSGVTMFSYKTDGPICGPATEIIIEP